MSDNSTVRGLYIDLLRDVIINEIYRDTSISQRRPNLVSKIFTGGERKSEKFDSDLRGKGLDWPSVAHSMIGRKRMDNLRDVACDVIEKGVPGDFIETGVWRGGACIFMRGILKAYGVTDRTVWVADSFAGLPKPDAKKYAADKGDKHHKVDVLAVTQEQVAEHFSRYGLLDDQVRFLKGWFSETLPTAPIDKLAILRLDGDMYESTMDGLVNLYKKVSPGGYVIVDDYYAVPACKAAVHDYLSRECSDETVSIQEIDGTGVYWRRDV
ncbi:MAG: TylF/MycF family methyltransferase [Albidovulum sp.]